MSNISFRTFIYKNLYLPVLAAWLITFSFIIDNYWSANASLDSVSNKLSGYINRQESDFETLMSDTAMLRDLQSGEYKEALLQRLSGKNYFLFFYNLSDSASEKLICWNTQQVLPSSNLLYEQSDRGFVNFPNANGYYVWLKSRKGSMTVLALVPIKWHYYIENDYLRNDFVVDRTLARHYDIGYNDGKSKVVKDRTGAALFHVYEKTSNTVFQNNKLAVVLQVIAFLLLLFFINLVGTFYCRHKNMWAGVFVLILMVVSLRALSYTSHFPINVRQFELFDPAVYGSGLILKSLGDFFINTLLFLWIVLFVRNQVIVTGFRLPHQHKRMTYAFLLVLSAVLLVLTFTTAYVVRSLVVDSQISFDVMNFFTLNQFSVIGFLLICLLCISYFFLSQLLVDLVKPGFGNFLFPLLMAVLIPALLLLSFRVGQIKGGFEIYVLLWMVPYLALLNSRLAAVFNNNVISGRLVFWLVFFSVSMSAIIMSENRKKEVATREKYAESLALKSDPANETLINLMLIDFREDFLAANFNRFREPYSSEALKDSLININTGRFTNKYDTHVYVFDAEGQSLYNEEAADYNKLNAILYSQAKTTGIPNLYYYDQSFDVFSYLTKKIIRNASGQTEGYVFIVISPKKQRKDALYPELFSKGRTQSIENSSSYAFAIYNNWKLVSSHNDYPFPSSITPQEHVTARSEESENGRYLETFYYSGSGKAVIIAKENNLLPESMTLFSYLFCSFLLMSGLFWLLHTLTAARLNKKRVLEYWQMSIRNQIHGTIIFISVISFLVIGIATIIFFINRYESTNREKLSRVIRIMEKEVKATLSGAGAMNSSVPPDSLSTDTRLGDMVRKISEIQGVDVNLFDLNGKLRLSSFPLPYNKGIISDKMDPLAFYHLDKLKEIQYFQNEKIGQLSFISNYVPVIDYKGDNYAYLNIPYYTSQNILKQEISNFLITIINLNAFIFLLSGIVSLFITTRISRSFAVITDKMKQINLGARNEAIVWKRKDEIGELVAEYNKMLQKLEASAAILAKTEREGAWKEMARQVAHEIKNPLTPMKLSLQFLQKSIDSKSANINELTQQVVHTLIEQIDHLSHIANAFSQFASIGEARKELFDMNDTLRHVILLHEVDGNTTISKRLLEHKVMIRADKTQINRLFTNLILNAIQAVPENRAPHLVISQQIQDNKVVVSVSDNGSGISEEIKSSIFTPNFTTKSSGTGLGLAMCKRIVEQSEGDIFFTTELGKGTTFVVSLPLSEAF